MMPHQIGRYEMRGEIGRGGMATVYLAYDPQFGREVAVKVMPPQLLHNPTFRARFEREAKTIAQLEHPSIVPVYDFGEYQGQPYIVMRLMRGGSLHARLISTPLSVPQAAYLLYPLASALDEAHARGIVHRDLKPGNILFDESDRPYITDFGIVKLSQASQKLTGTGDVIGTPAYMSPEQAHGDRTVDAKSDIYSLGVILFEMLTGQVPYQANTPIKLMMKHILDPVPRILDVKADLPQGCEAIIAQAMDKDPNNRFPTASHLSTALTRLGQSLPNPIPVPLPAPPPFQVTPTATPPASQSPVVPPAQGGNNTPIPSQPIPPSPLPTPPRITPPPPAAPVQPKQQYSTRQSVALGVGMGVLLMLLVVAIMSFGSNGEGNTEAFTATPSEESEVAAAAETPTTTPTAEQTKTATATTTKRPTKTPTLTPTKTPDKTSTNTPITVPTPIPSKTPTITPTPPPLSGHIVFASDRDSQENIFIVSAEGGQEPIRISNSGLDYAPFWSTDTGQIIFTSKREGKLDIYSMAPDGRQVERLTDSERGITNPLLSPDGSRIAFEVNGQLGWVTLATGRLTIHDIYVSGFAWSPDGQRLALTNTSYRSEGGVQLQVDVLDIDKPALSSETLFEGICDTYDGCNNPVWSPDGQKITFSLAPDEPYKERGIYVMNADGSNLMKVADVENAQDSNPVWSPDGASLLFVSTSDTRSDDSINNCDNSVIYRVSVDGNNLTRLTENNVSSHSPVWSPDSQRVTFTMFENQSNEVYVMNVDGSNKSRLSNPIHNADEYAARWSPDGSQVVFASSEYAPKLYVLKPAASTTELIVSDAPGVVYSNPRITSNGKSLAFTRQHSFSSKNKSLTGGINGSCSSISLAIISEPTQFGGAEIPDSSKFSSGRSIRNWSNDEQRLLYTGWNNESLQIWDRSTETSTTVDVVPERAFFHSTLSPDGKEVAYYDSNDDQVYLASLASDEKTNLSLGANPSYNSPQFSPDGKSVLFQVNGGMQIRDLTGTLQHEIQVENGNLESYTWLPNSNGIAYEIWDRGDESESRLWVYNLPRQEATHIATISGDISNLSTSPDGLWLIFNNNTTGNNEIYAIPMTGGAVINLTNNPANEYSPAWVP